MDDTYPAGRLPKGEQVQLTELSVWQLDSMKLGEVRLLGLRPDRRGCDESIVAAAVNKSIHDFTAHEGCLLVPPIQTTLHGWVFERID